MVSIRATATGAAIGVAGLLGGFVASAALEPGAQGTESFSCQGADVDVTLATPPSGSGSEPLNGQVVILDPDLRDWEVTWSTPDGDRTGRRGTTRARTSTA